MSRNIFNLNKHNLSLTLKYSSQESVKTAPFLAFISDVHEYQAYPYKTFYISGDNLHESTLSFYLRPRTGGPDIPLSLIEAPDVYHVRVQIPSNCPTGVQYNIVGLSRFGYTNVLTGNFHPKAIYSYTGITVNNFTYGNTPYDPYNCQQWWGLANGGGNLGNPQNVVNLGTGKTSSNGGYTWSNNTVAGWSTGYLYGNVNQQITLSTIGTSSGTFTLTFTSPSIAYTSTTVAISTSPIFSVIGFNSSTLLSGLNSMLSISTGNVVVSPYIGGLTTVTFSGYRYAGLLLNNFVVNGGGGLVTSFISTPGSGSDWSTNLRKCIDYIYNTYGPNSGTKDGGIVYIPTGYYYIDGEGYHTDVTTSATSYNLFNSSSWYKTSFVGDGPSQSILIFGNARDGICGKNLTSQNYSTAAIMWYQSGITGLGFCNIGLLNNYLFPSQYASDNGYVYGVVVFETNSAQTIKYILYSNTKVFGKGLTYFSGRGGEINSGCVVIRNFDAHIAWSANGIQFNAPMDNLTCDSATFNWSKGRYSTGGTYNACITNNDLSLFDWNDQAFPTQTVFGALPEAGGMELSFTVNLLVAKNQLVRRSGGIGIVGSREGLLTQCSVYPGLWYPYQSVLTCSSNVVVIGSSLGGSTPAGLGQGLAQTAPYGPKTGNTSAIRYGQEIEYCGLCVTGTGQGQWRFITGITTTNISFDTITFDTAWSPALDTTSSLYIYCFNNANHTYVRNYLGNWGAPISNYSGSLNTRAGQNVAYSGIMYLPVSQTYTYPIIQINPSFTNNISIGDGQYNAGVLLGYEFTAGVTTIYPGMTTAVPAGGLVHNILIKNHYFYSGGIFQLISQLSSNEALAKDLFLQTPPYSGLTTQLVEGNTSNIIFSNIYQNDVIATPFQQNSKTYTTAVNASTYTTPNLGIGTPAPSDPTRSSLPILPSAVIDPNSNIYHNLGF